MIPAISQWRYTTSDPGNQGWIHTLPNWPSYTTGAFPIYSSTRYFAQSITIDYRFKTLPILEIDVYTREGFILYINGEEVNRYNLPAGSVNHNTVCLQTHDAPVWRRVTVSGAQYLNSNSILIAAQVHKGTATGLADEFKLIAMPVAQGMLLLL